MRSRTQSQWEHSRRRTGILARICDAISRVQRRMGTAAGWSGLVLTVVWFSAAGLVGIAASDDRHDDVPGSRVASDRDRGPDQPDALPVWAKVSEQQLEASKALGVPAYFENGLGMRFVLIPAGTFRMGSPTTESGRLPGEVLHRVEIPVAFYMQITEVQNGQYAKFDADHSSERLDEAHSLSGPDQPVVLVSWVHANGFADWLSRKDKDREYRVPTEAEWEYACRAGTKGAYSWGQSDVEFPKYANCADVNCPVRPIESELDDGFGVSAPVARFQPNAWGLYDMHGNVREWCEGVYLAYEPSGEDELESPVEVSGGRPTRNGAAPLVGRMRVIRGGGWSSPTFVVRSAYRDRGCPTQTYLDLGFRLVSLVCVARGQ